MAESAGRLLEDLGHSVEPVRIPHDNDALTAVMSTVSGAVTRHEVDQRLAELGRELDHDTIEPFTRFIYDLGAAASGADVVGAFGQLEVAARASARVFEGADVVLTPTLAKPVPQLGYLDVTDVETMIERASAFSVLTSPFNITEQPAISLPLGTDSVGIPVGVQLVAPFGAEALLLSVAAQIEVAAPWPIAPVWPAVEG